MKILGIVGSSRKEGVSSVHQLVTTVLENTGYDFELVSLRGKKIGGCIACLGCVKDNICKVKDDLTDLRPLIAEADVYDALISKRVYKPAFSHDKAMNILREGNAKHFDPDMIDALNACEDEFIEISKQFHDEHTDMV
jgi:hypothetical protein